MSDHDADSPADARAALTSVAAMKAAAVRRARAPCWLRVGFALALGGFVASQAAPDPAAALTLFPAALLFMFLLGGGCVRAMPKQESTVAQQVMTILGFAVFVLAFLFAGRLLRETYGLRWAPLPLGAAVAAAVFLFVESRTRAYARRHGLAAPAPGRPSDGEPRR